MGRPKGVKNKPKHEKKVEMQLESTNTETSKPASIITNPTRKEREMADDLRMVKGTFIYRAKPGGRYQTTLRKYKSMPAFPKSTGFYKLNMVDGETHTIPHWVAKWLNGEEDLSCCDWRHDSSQINLEEESRRPPEKVPVFRFIIQEYVS